jgi:hypothetical protein
MLDEHAMLAACEAGQDAVLVTVASLCPARLYKAMSQSPKFGVTFIVLDQAGETGF